MEASVVGQDARSAQDAAFERFYRRYAQHVYRYTLALLRNPADAEDVTQTTFMNAYRAMSQGQYPRKPHHWLIKIAHNSCRSRYVMRRRRVVEVPLDDEVDQLVAPEQEKPNIRLVLRALGRLPFNQRAALVMRELEGRSYAEIAETLGVSVSAVEMLIFRARKSMRVHARSLRALGAVQLPGSLVSFFGSGGGVAATAGVGGALGAGAIAKLVAALAAATVIAGATGGAMIADAQSTPEATPVSEDARATSGGSTVAPRDTARSAEVKATRVQRRTVLSRQASRPVRHAVPPAGDAPSGSDRVHSGSATSTASAEATESAGSSGPGGTVTKTVTSKVPKAPPAVPTPPQVDVPQVSAPPLPPLPVEPPPLPPPPKLP